ncbi:hypothetical protein FL583_00325 [Cryptosporangium phraense]|uniref:UBC core domain-containing protein n=2 Tax=Cryptosporangium phraense TaxID=2593070 RepID=A0A545AZM1_9ACTN|nr:hypothetical protein FL583_00325 [Cryptosporangium phraense]
MTLRRVLPRIFAEAGSARDVLLRIGLRPDQILPFADARTFWQEMFARIDAGAVQQPHYRLLAEVLEVYPYHPQLRELAERYGVIGPGDHDEVVPFRSLAAADEPDPEPEPEPSPVEGIRATDLDDRVVHVLVRAGSEDERQTAEATLAGLGLEPQEVWSTPYAVSFAVAFADPATVRRRLDDTDLSWNVVPPGRRDYLLRALYVEGPDGRAFRIRDVPAQQTVGDVSAQVMGAEYPTSDPTRNVVVEHLKPDGTDRRLNSQDTLDDAGVRDGDRVRLGVEATAGSINPLDRQDALFRARNQLMAFADSRPDVSVRANSTELPTEYEIDFVARSFAPGPPSSGAPDEPGDPVETSKHQVRIQLPPEFPIQPPLVFWVTPIFHPNVYPNYDGPLARKRPFMRGKVCLGALDELYQPSLDFSELAQVLVDIAGFRNYGLFEVGGAVDEEPTVRGNYYDRRAAEWVWDNQDRIAGIGGTVFFRPRSVGGTYRNVIEFLPDPDDSDPDDPRSEDEFGAGGGG